MILGFAVISLFLPRALCLSISSHSNSECYSEIWNHHHHHHHHRWIYIFARLHSTFKWKGSFTQLKHHVPIGRRRFVLSSDGASSIENSCSCMHGIVILIHTLTRNLLGARTRARSKSYATAATTYFNCSIPIQWTRAQIFDDAENAIDCHIYIIIIARTHRHSLRARHTHGGRVLSDGTLTI